MEAFMKYLGIVALLVFVFLVVTNGPAAANVLGALSKANTNAIIALQGRGNFASF